VAHYLVNSSFFGTLKKKCCRVWESISIKPQKKSSLIFIRFFLALTIFLPSLFVYAHELANHDHIECEETKIHFHQTEEPCSGDDFVLQNNFFVAKISFVTAIFSNEEKEYHLNSHLKRNDLNGHYLRGPPSV